MQHRSAHLHHSRDSAATLLPLNVIDFVWRQQSKQTTTMQRSKLLPRSTDRVAERATMLHDLIGRRTTTRTHRHTRAGTVPLVDFPPFIAHTPQNPCTFVFLRTITNHTNTLSATQHSFPLKNNACFCKITLTEIPVSCSCCRCCSNVGGVAAAAASLLPSSHHRPPDRQSTTRALSASVRILRRHYIGVQTSCTIANQQQQHHRQDSYICTYTLHMYTLKDYVANWNYYNVVINGSTLAVY